MEARDERWAHVSLRKLHGKNISYAFVMMYLKDGPLRMSSECFAMLLY